MDHLDLSLSGLHLPHTLTQIDKASNRLVRAVKDRELILIVGDFDADGATATAVSVSLLSAMGASQVDYLVPNRFEFGYGLTPEIVTLALAKEPAVIMTVDNGISSHEGIQLAQQKGVDVIVTDHHLPGAEIPAAHAIVNPNFPNCPFPSKALAGVGVVYYVLSAVRAKLRKQRYFQKCGIEVPNLAEWLDLVALGTVADVVPLDRNNRILVYQGLRRMRAGLVRPGLRALAEVAGRALGNISAQDLGYALGPRLNAAGRLDDMSIGIQCLLAPDLLAARSIATALDELNKTRREIELSMTSEATVLIDDSDAHQGSAICVYDEGWHQGVIGIVAGRMRERFHRPVIAFADAGENSPNELKGSARSIRGLHIRDAIDDVATRYPGLIETFGGHAMAAGISIKNVHFKRFSRAFRDAVDARLTEGDLAGILLTDGELQPSELSLDNARLIAAHGPWGQSFEEPTFHGEFDVVSQRVVGERHLKLVLKLGVRLVDAIAFNQSRVGSARVRALYRLGINDFSDAETLQLVVEEMEPC